MQKLIFLLLFTIGAAAAEFDAGNARKPPGWTIDTYTGIEGGIRPRTTPANIIDVTQPPYNADPTGVTFSDAAVRGGGLGALENVAPEGVLYFPAGTYKFQYGAFAFSPSLDKVTVRGEMSGSTRLTTFRFVEGSGYASIGPSYPVSPNSITISSGLTRNSSTLTCVSTAGVSVGDILRIFLSDDPTIPIVDVEGYYNQRREQITRVTGVDGDGVTLTISPSIYGDYNTTNTTAHYLTSSQYAELVGIEDINIVHERGPEDTPFIFESAVNCWMKNVKITGDIQFFVDLKYCFRVQLSQVWVNNTGTPGAPNHSGIRLSSVCASVFEDNIVYGQEPGFQCYHGNAGNVFAYNVVSATTKGFLTTHGPHNNFNLYEGNVSPNMQCDGYTGSTSHDYFFRNYFVGASNVDGTGSGTGGIILNRFTRQYTFVGNLLPGPGSFGNPNLGNSAFTGTARPSDGDWWAYDWDTTNNRVMKWTGTVATGGGTNTGTITLNTGEGTSFQGHLTNAVEGKVYFANSSGGLINENTIPSGVSGDTVTIDGYPLPANGQTVYFYPSYNGFQEQDQDTFPDWDTTWSGTTLMRGNHYYDKPTDANVATGTPGIPAFESLGTDTLPNSMYRTTAPDYFTGYTWPAFDPASPNRNYTAIPAGYRFANGDSTPTGKPHFSLPGRRRRR